MVILSAVAFAIFSIPNNLKCYTLVQFIFDRYMILLVKYNMDWQLISQKNQVQINKYNNCKNIKTVYYD